MALQPPFLRFFVTKTVQHYLKQGGSAVNVILHTGELVRDI